MGGEADVPSERVEKRRVGMILYVERCDRRSQGSPGWRSPLEDDTQATSVYVCTRYTVYDQTDGRMRAEEGPPGLSRQRKKISCPPD